MGEDAARTLLSWPATPASVVPPASAWPLRSVGVVESVTSSGLPAQRTPLIRAYVEKLAHGNAGSGRSDRLFSLARFLRDGVQCSDAEGLGVLRAWNGGNAPPLDDAKVIATWQNAARYNAQPLRLRAGVRHAA